MNGPGNKGVRDNIGFRCDFKPCASDGALRWSIRGSAIANVKRRNRWKRNKESAPLGHITCGGFRCTYSWDDLEILIELDAQMSEGNGRWRNNLLWSIEDVHLTVCTIRGVNVFTTEYAQWILETTVLKLAKLGMFVFHSFLWLCSEGSVM